MESCYEEDSSDVEGAIDELVPMICYGDGDAATIRKALQVNVERKIANVVKSDGSPEDDLIANAEGTTDLCLDALAGSRVNGAARRGAPRGARGGASRRCHGLGRRGVSALMRKSEAAAALARFTTEIPRCTPLPLPQNPPKGALRLHVRVLFINYHLTSLNSTFRMMSCAKLWPIRTLMERSRGQGAEEDG